MDVPSSLSSEIERAGRCVRETIVAQVFNPCERLSNYVTLLFSHVSSIQRRLHGLKARATLRCRPGAGLCTLNEEF